MAGAGISDWQSYYGENSIDQWMTPYFGASVYDDPAVYAKSSAINFIKQVQTPTLVVVGDRDGECPAPQSFEFWHALRDAACADATGGLSQRGAWVCGPGASAGRDGAGGGVVCAVYAGDASSQLDCSPTGALASLCGGGGIRGWRCRARGSPVLIHFSLEFQSVFRRPAARKSVLPGAGH